MVAAELGLGYLGLRVKTPYRLSIAAATTCCVVTLLGVSQGSSGAFRLRSRVPTSTGKFRSFLMVPLALARGDQSASYILHLASVASLSSSMFAGRIGAPRSGAREQGVLSADILVCAVHRSPVISHEGVVTLLVCSFGCFLLGCGHSVFMFCLLICFVKTFPHHHVFV